MSGLAGVRWLDDGRRAAAGDLRGPLAGLRHRGPDGLFAAASGPCALGIAQMITTPEARLERQPFEGCGELVVTLDGRVDNRDELCAALGLRNEMTLSDVALVAAAWERWEADALAAVLGDFALAVWSGRERRLWLARDIFGLRPLYYRSFGGGWWWASELQTLARLGGPRVNDGMVAEYLADAVRSETETLVHGVLRVPRASVMTLNANGTSRSSRYWSPALRAPRRYRRDGEAVEAFRSVFVPAVRARVRSDRPIALALSGGLDSSLIAAECRSLPAMDLTPSIQAFTLGFPGDPADESGFARVVASYLQMSHVVCPPGRAGLEPILRDAERALDLPQTLNSMMAEPMQAALGAGEWRVCLNGVGANEWFCGSHFAFADELRSMRLMSMARRIRAYQRANSAYRPWRDLRLALWLQLPDGAKHHLRRMLGLTQPPSWIERGFAARTGLTDRLRAGGPVPMFPGREQRIRFDWATCADKMFLTEYTERINAAAGYEERSPFLDRRVAEWALGLPDDQRWRNGTGKVVLRHAAAGVLPEPIVSRGPNPNFSFQTSQALRDIGGMALVMSIAEERANWVDANAVRGLWDRVMAAEKPGGQRLGYYAWVLWLLVGTHFAARAIENLGGPPAETDGA